jgi:hypothetical protein
LSNKSLASPSGRARNHLDLHHESLGQETSVLSQKFADKVFVMPAAFSQPRQGRKIVAQGASPGVESPHTAFGTPLPPERERGRG